MPRELFEFYCSANGGGCGGYFRVRLRTEINGAYTVVCPNCGHHHNREIKDGVITSDRRNEAKEIEKIMVPKSAFSKEPVLERVKPTDPTDAKALAKYKIDEENALPVDGKTRRELLWNRFAGRT